MTPTPVGLVLSGRRVNTAQPKKKKETAMPPEGSRPECRIGETISFYCGRAVDDDRRLPHSADAVTLEIPSVWEWSTR
jgi:hypothetical protein